MKNGVGSTLGAGLGMFYAVSKRLGFWQTAGCVLVLALGGSLIENVVRTKFSDD